VRRRPGLLGGSLLLVVSLSQVREGSAFQLRRTPSLGSARLQAPRAYACRRVEHDVVDPGSRNHRSGQPGNSMTGTT